MRQSERTDALTDLFVVDSFLNSLARERMQVRHLCHRRLAQFPLVAQLSFAAMTKSLPGGSRPCLSLEKLCIHKALDNLDMLGDVGALDTKFLDILLRHCTAEQLWNIEEATKDRDLSKITDGLWMKCYSRRFGKDSVDAVVSAMTQRKKVFKWKILYQRKLKEEDQVAEQCVKSLTAKYKAAVAQKASRQITQIDKAPPTSKKRGGIVATSRLYAAAPLGVKGRLMKKARQECINFNRSTRPAPPPKKTNYPKYLEAIRKTEDARRMAISERSDGH